MALLSSLAGAGAVAIATWVVYSLGRRSGFLTPWQSALVAGGCGLLLGVSPVYWSQATIGEVYAMLGLFSALACLLMVFTPLTPGEGKLRSFATGLTFGVGMGVHFTILFLAPLWVSLAWGRVTRGGLLAAAVGFGCGLAVFGALPVLAARQPPVSWGDASTLEGFVWMVTGGPYRGFLDPLALARDGQRGLDMLPVTMRQLGGIGWVLAGSGALNLWRTDRRMALGLTLPILLCFAYVFVYQTPDAHVYLIPALICAAILAGLGASGLLASMAGERRDGATVMVATAILLAVIITVAVSWEQLDLSKDRTALVYAETVTADRTPEDIVLADGDRHIFSLWYYCGVVKTGSCPHIVVPALLQYDWYRRQVAARTGLISGDEKTYTAALADVLALAHARPVFISTDTYRLPEGYAREPLPSGLYRIVPTQD
jgi:hypothetical protein